MTEQNKPDETKPETTTPSANTGTQAPVVNTTTPAVTAPVQTTPTITPAVDTSSETDNDESDEDTGLVDLRDELEVLKQRARLLGIQFHSSIGVTKLREKVNLAVRKTGGEVIADDEYEGDGSVTDKGPSMPKAPQYTFEELVSGYAELKKREKLTKSQLRNEANKDAGKLIRIRVTCMDPNKREWQGEIFTVSNSIVGTFKKFVPFNNPEGWYVPQIIYTAIKERQCQVFVTGTVNGQRTKRAVQIPAFNVEVLDPLSQAELKELAQRQAMAAGVAD